MSSTDRLRISSLFSKIWTTTWSIENWRNFLVEFRTWRKKNDVHLCFLELIQPLRWTEENLIENFDKITHSKTSNTFSLCFHESLMEFFKDMNGYFYKQPDLEMRYVWSLSLPTVEWALADFLTEYLSADFLVDLSKLRRRFSIGINHNVCFTEYVELLSGLQEQKQPKSTKKLTNVPHTTVQYYRY